MDKPDTEAGKEERNKAERNVLFNVDQNEPVDSGDQQLRLGKIDNVTDETDYGILIEPSENLVTEQEFRNSDSICGIKKEADHDGHSINDDGHGGNQDITEEKQYEVGDTELNVENSCTTDGKTDGKDKTDMESLVSGEEPINVNLDFKVIIYSRNSTNQTREAHSSFSGKFVTQDISCSDHEKTFQCDTCKRSYDKVSDLEKHYLVHTGESRFSCDICQTMFTREDYLLSHMDYHSGVKPHICSFCSRAFATEQNLRMHKSSHKKKRSKVCEICKREFETTKSLVVHLRTHTGEKPYQCSVCHKSFSTVSNLSVHCRIHTGEKPYQCTVCHKLFSQQGSLIRHRRTHTGEETE